MRSRQSSLRLSHNRDPCPQRQKHERFLHLCLRKTKHRSFHFLWILSKGPSRESRENGNYDVLFCGDINEESVHVSVTGDMDPGRDPYLLSQKHERFLHLCLRKTKHRSFHFLWILSKGPSRESRENGNYDVLFCGDINEESVHVSVAGDMDPGYGSTSKMIAESAICLVKECADLDGGIYTPAPSMGTKLIKRLQDNAGLTFKIEN